MMRAQLVPGERFDDRYDVVRCLSSGGMGTVYEVIQRETRRRRALKLMHTDLADNPVLRRRFALEARVAAEVDSAHVVEIVDARLDGADTPYIVMELLRGEDLEKVLARRGAVEPFDALVVLQQLGSALDKTHARGIVHRDLKPSNLFVMQREDGMLHVKILDFGVAKLLDDSLVSANKTGIIGTPLYMAPEQVCGLAPTPAVDRYALAQIAFSLLVGHPYWARECAGDVPIHALLLKIMTGCSEPATERALRSGVVLPEAFDAWFARATATDPEQRYPTCAEAVEDLADALDMDLPAPQRISEIFADGPVSDAPVNSAREPVSLRRATDEIRPPEIPSLFPPEIPALLEGAPGQASAPCTGTDETAPQSLVVGDRAVDPALRTLDAGSAPIGAPVSMLSAGVTIREVPISVRTPGLPARMAGTSVHEAQDDAIVPSLAVVTMSTSSDAPPRKRPGVRSLLLVGLGATIATAVILFVSGQPPESDAPSRRAAASPPRTLERPEGEQARWPPSELVVLPAPETATAPTSGVASAQAPPRAPSAGRPGDKPVQRADSSPALPEAPKPRAPRQSPILVR